MINLDMYISKDHDSSYSKCDNNMLSSQALTIEINWFSNPPAKKKKNQKWATLYDLSYKSVKETIDEEYYKSN